MDKKIGVVGIGNFGLLHIQALKQNPEAQVWSICARTESKLQRVCYDHGIPHYFTDIDKMLADTELEGVIIATGEDTHYEYTQKAVKAGKHVLLEKPICLTQEASDKIRALEHSAVVHVLPGHILRFDASYSQLKTILSNSDSGTLQSICVKRNVPVERFVLHSRTHPIFMALAHDIDMIIWLTGSRVKRVCGMSQKTQQDSQSPDIVFAVAEMENGVICNLETQWRLPNEYGRYLDAELEMMTSAGNIKLHSPGDMLSSMLKGRQAHYDTTLWPQVNGKWTGALVSEQRHFLDLITGRTDKPVVTVEEATYGIEFCLMLIESCETGRIVQRG